MNEDAASRKWRRLGCLIPIGAIFLALAVLACFIPGDYYRRVFNPPKLIIPAASEIDEMRVSIDTEVFITKQIPEFTVPKDHIPALLAILGPTRLCDFSAPAGFFTEMRVGTVKIRTLDGIEKVFYLADLGKNPILLSQDGKFMFWGGHRDIHDKEIHAGGSVFVNEVEKIYNKSKSK